MNWIPEDREFWITKGQKIARKNLWISIPALFLALAVWMVWSAVVTNLPKIGFNFTTDQLFWLVSISGLSGATLRIFYSFMIPIFGGRYWTAISTASLLIPTIGIGMLVQNPDSTYHQFLMLSILCGLGGANFASSMTNIAYLYPKKEKGHALALNAGLGNLGVSAVQFFVPLVITVGIFGGTGQIIGGKEIWLQNAGYIWVPFIAASAITAWLFMDDVSVKSSLSDQIVIFKRKHNWIMCLLYGGTFGSFIGFSAGFPLLANLQFPDVNSLQLAFIGPLVGAIARAGSGWASDRFGGARVTLGVFAITIVATLGIMYFMDLHSFVGFFAVFLILFAATGIGSASVFQMIPTIFWKEAKKNLPNASDEEVRKTAERESAAVIGFSSAMGAYGAFFIPKSYGTAISITGTPNAALITFILFYAVCLFLTWFYYIRESK